MIKEKQTILNAIEEAQILGIFKNFCYQNASSKEKIRLRNIYYLSNDRTNTTIEIIKRQQNIILNRTIALRLTELINAFLKKSNYRIKITENTKNTLLIKQNYECAICGSDTKHKYHADHIVPFKYVGDELENNLQILCPNCNERKNDSIDYEIKYLLKLI